MFINAVCKRETGGVSFFSQEVKQALETVLQPLGTPGKADYAR